MERVVAWGREARLEFLIVWPSSESARYYERAGFAAGEALERDLFADNAP